MGVKFELKNGKVYRVVVEEIEKENLEKYIDEEGFYDVVSLMKVVFSYLFGDVFKYEYDIRKNIEISRMYDKDFYCDECVDYLFSLYYYLEEFVDEYDWDVNKIVWDKKYYEKIYKYYKLIKEKIDKGECSK